MQACGRVFGYGAAIARHFSLFLLRIAGHGDVLMLGPAEHASRAPLLDFVESPCKGLGAGLADGCDRSGASGMSIERGEGECSGRERCKPTQNGGPELGPCA
jgi:hypothetical protein